MFQSSSSRRLLALALLGFGLSAGGIQIGAMVWAYVERGFLGDWNVFWQAGRIGLARIYVTSSFPYPPTALALFRLFSLPPFGWSFAAWTAFQGIALFVAALRIAPINAVVIGFLGVAVFGTLMGGQASLFTAALAIAGLTAKDPRVGGILFGVLAAFKPQAAAAVPLALLLMKDFPRLTWAVLTGACLGVLTIAAWGPDIWFRWLGNLGSFVDYLTERDINRRDVGLYGLSLRFGLPSWLYFLGIPLGVAVIWKAFAREAEALDRYVALTVGNIQLVPYTLGYDLAGLSIAAAALLLDRRRTVWEWVGAAGVMSGIMATPGLLLLAAHKLLSGAAFNRSAASALR